SLFPARDEQNLVGRTQVPDLAGDRSARLRGDGRAVPDPKGGRRGNSEASAIFNSENPRNRKANEPRRHRFSGKRRRVNWAGCTLDSSGTHFIRYFGHDPRRSTERVVPNSPRRSANSTHGYCWASAP